jgi:hypothetical protein
MRAMVKKKKNAGARLLNLGEFGLRVHAIDEIGRFTRRLPGLMEALSGGSTHKSVGKRALSIAVGSTLPADVETLFNLFEKIEDPKLRDEITIAFIRIFDSACTAGGFEWPTEQTENMRKARQAKRAPSVDRRKEILKSSTLDLEKIANSRKEADAAAKDFGPMCKREGVAPVSGKQLQRDARDILKERHEKPGHS